jgi:hypothetical protein
LRRANTTETVECEICNSWKTSDCFVREGGYVIRHYVREIIPQNDYEHALTREHLSIFPAEQIGHRKGDKHACCVRCLRALVSNWTMEFKTAHRPSFAKTGPEKIESAVNHLEEYGGASDSCREAVEFLWALLFAMPDDSKVLEVINGFLKKTSMLNHQSGQTL